MSKIKRFKIKHIKLNLAIVVYARMQLWKLVEDDLNIDDLFYVYNLNYEMEALDRCIKLYRDFLNNNFQTSYEENLKNLDNKSYGYHQHFALIYRLER